MSKDTTKSTSPAITYPEPIEFDKFEDFLDRIESAIGSLEGDGIDLVESDTLEFLKGINSETAGANLRWLGDLLDRNYDKFQAEIERRQSDDGVDFLEDGATPTGEPDFIDATPEDEAAMRGGPIDGMNERLNKMMEKADGRIRGNA